MTLSAGSFIDTLTSIAVTGVNRVYEYPPLQLNTADLPAAFPRYPLLSGGLSTVGFQPGLTEVTCEYVIVVEAGRQGLPPENWDDTLALVDNLNTALRANIEALNLDRWRIEVNVNLIGETPYHVIIAELEASA